MRSMFPRERLSKADYVLALSLVGVCFALFFHADIWGVGWDSLNYLFGSPLEFYENCKRIRGGGSSMLGTPYPPPVYVIFAVWLYPLKVLGVIADPQTFPLYLTYWLKVLTTLAYAASGVLFHRIALHYGSDRRWAWFASIIWLTTPIALFSQFIFSQYDICYVLLVMAGFLAFLRDGIYRASFCFGLAITFKYFPTFAFLPLLLLHEKRIGHIALCLLVFAAPLWLVELPYSDSAAFIEGVKNHVAIDRVFTISMDLGREIKGFRIYFLFASFAVVCGLSYFMQPAAADRQRAAAYIWLVGSILPFLFIFWHPQWAIAFAPAVALTSLLSIQRKQFMLLDLAGMAVFVATVSLVFQRNVDADLFKAHWLGIDFGNSFLMARLFDWFGAHSVSVFWSGFWAYLVLQVVLKHRLLHAADEDWRRAVIDYGEARQRLYVGLLMFLLPAGAAIGIDWRRHETFTINHGWSSQYGELARERRFEQSFIADGHAISRVSLLFTTFDRSNRGTVTVEIIDSAGHRLAQQTCSVHTFRNAGWQDFSFGRVRIRQGASYRIRLSAAEATEGNAVGWMASSHDSYPHGAAIVDGVPQNADFSFRVGFAR
jgi:hypothetical protein